MLGIVVKKKKKKEKMHMEEITVFPQSKNSENHCQKTLDCSFNQKNELHLERNKAYGSI